MKSHSLFIAMFFTAAVGYAEVTRPDLRLAAFGHAPLAPTANEGVVVFLDEDPAFSVDVAYRTPSAVAAEKLEGWWKGLQLVISDAGGVVRTLQGVDLEIIESRVKGKLVAGTAAAGIHSPSPEPTYIRFKLRPLPAGDYTMRVSAPVPDEEGGVVTLKSFVEPFSIRRGDEDRDIRRLYLRKQARAAADYAGFKKVMNELRSIEPESFQLAEELADRSLHNAAPEETLALYREARALREAVAQRYEKSQRRPLTAPERTDLERDVLRLSFFEKVLADYKRGDRRLVPFSLGTDKHFAWTDRDGRLLGVIDLRDPSIVRPVRRERP